MRNYKGKKRISFLRELDAELYKRGINIIRLFKEEPLILFGLTNRRITLKNAIKGEFPKISKFSEEGKDDILSQHKCRSI